MPWRSRIVRTVVADTLIPSSEELPADPLVSPARVLPAEPEDEVADGVVGRRPAELPRLPEGPLPPDEFPVPAQERLRPHRERRPAAPGHRPARRCEQDPVETVDPGALDLPVEHLHLVPEHQELDVPRSLLATSGFEETADQEVEEREQHEAPSPVGDRMLLVPPTTNLHN